MATLGKRAVWPIMACMFALIAVLGLTPVLSFGDESASALKVEDVASVDLVVALDEGLVNTVEAVASVKSGTSVYGKLDFVFNNLALANSAGGIDPVFVYRFPDNIDVGILAGESGTLTKPDGQEAIGTWSFSAGALHFSFERSWFDEHSNDVTASARFMFAVDKSQTEGSEPLTLVFPGVAEPVQIRVLEEAISKGKTGDSSKVGEAGHYVYYESHITTTEAHESLTMTDTLQSNLVFDKASFTLNGEAFTPTFSENDTVATFELGKREAGTYTLKYRAQLTDAALAQLVANPGVVLSHTRNTAQWTVDGIALDPDSTSFELVGEFLKKSYEVSDDDISVLDWTVTLNADDKLRMDLSDFLASDKLYDGHAYVGSYVVRNSAGKELARGNVDGSYEFSYRFPAAGAWDGFDPSDSYTISYSTKLNGRAGTFKNVVVASRGDLKAEAVVEGGGEDSISVGKKFTGDVFVAAATGRHSWQATLTPVFGTSITRPEDQVSFVDEARTQGMRFIREGKGSPQVSAKGVALEKDVDYAVSFNDANTSFEISFKNTDAMKKAFLGKVVVDYETQMDSDADGSVIQADKYVNSVSVEYLGNASHDEATVPGATKGALVKNVRTDEDGNDCVTRQDDGRYVVGWHLLVNGKNEYLAASPLSEDIVVTETLPEGMEYVEGSLAVGLYRGGWSERGNMIADQIEPELSTKDGRQVLTIVVPVAQLAQRSSAGYVKALVHIDLDTRTTEPVASDAYLSFTNEAAASSGQIDLGAADQTVLVRNKALDKAGSYKAGSGNKVSYTIKVNDMATDLLADSDTISLWDVLDASCTFDPASFSVHELAADGSLGADITDACSVSGEPATDAAGAQSTKLVVTVPDARAVQVYYEAFVAGELGEELTLVNQAGLVFSSNSDVSDETEMVIKEASMVATGRAGTFTFTKVDSSDLTKPLAGAHFELYRVTDIATGEAVLVDSAVTSDSADAAGKVVWHKDGNNKTLILGELYYFVETQAPAGYKLDATKHYFMLEGGNYAANKQAAKDAGINYSASCVATVINVPHDPVEVSISKTDVAGAELPGATIKIIAGESDAGEVLLSWVSTDEPHVVKLAPGAYTLVEETAPHGYVVAESITFKVAEDGSVQVRQADGSYVAAADSTVVMVDGPEETPEPEPKPEPKPEPTPDPTPEPTPESEPEPAPDPTPDPEPTPQQDPDPAPTPQPDFAPVLEKHEVNFKKTDIAGSEIAGATVKIVAGEGETGDIVETWVSDGSTHVVKLAPGAYTLVEETAPHGYVVAESITFKVAEDGTVQVRQADGSYVAAADSTVVMVDGPETVKRDEPVNDPKTTPTDDPKTTPTDTTDTKQTTPAKQTDPAKTTEPSAEKKDTPSTPTTRSDSSSGTKPGSTVTPSQTTSTTPTAPASTSKATTNTAKTNDTAPVGILGTLVLVAGTGLAEALRRRNSAPAGRHAR